jgi:hypothetical protein
MARMRRGTALLAKAKPSQAAPAGRPALLSEKISSLADAHGRLDWPSDVVRAMQALKVQADRLQALIDTASQSGSKIGDLAATMEAGAGPESVQAGEAW